MKRTGFLLLLLCLPFLLPAQDKPGYFALKPGDWFDMQITIDKDSNYFPVMEPLLLCHKQYVFRYHLTAQLPNGSQQYRIVQERIAIYQPRGIKNGWLGYDSYYPPYKQRLTPKPPKGTYLLEITGDGQIVSLQADKNRPFLPVTLTNISPQREVGVAMASSTAPMKPQAMQEIVNMMLKHRGRENNVPLRIRSEATGYSQLLTAASFPVDGNVLIKGKLAHAREQEVSIEIAGTDYTFPVNSNGQFSCPLLLQRPEASYFAIENNSSYVFLMPGDTLEIDADANTSHPMILSGHGKWNCKLADGISDIFYYNNNGVSKIQTAKSLEEVFKMQKEATTKFNAVIQLYTGKASPVSIDYYKTAWRYHIAEDWLFFLYVNNYRADSSLPPFQRIPEIVTAGIDNMPVVVNPYPNNYFYKKYFEWFLPYQKSRISLSAGGNNEAFSFYGDYYVLLATLKGYPLYYKLAKGISEEMKSVSYTKNQRLKPYFEDFIHNCDDSSFIRPMIKDWQLMERWAPGNHLPVSRLPLANGNTYEVKPLQGKTTCVVFDHASYFEDSILIGIVKSHPEVSFIYAWINEPFLNRQPTAGLKALSNISFIELKNKEGENYAIYGLPELGKKNIVVLDQWGRIVEDHIHAEDNVWDDLREVIDAAAKIPRFSSTQKSNIMNITGWSLGSIMFTTLAGIWIYLVRISRIKKAEAMKTTIRELEVKAIRSQMNPHFIFNALNSIQSLINTTQYKAANTYLVKFSLLLRSVLHNAEKNTLPLIDELNTIRLYCELEQLRFDFTFEMEISDDIPADLVEIPGMVLQPLVENAIIHGIAAKGKAGLLKIKTTKQDSCLQIAVYDNGNGFHTAATNDTHKSVGLKLVQERLRLFSIAGQNAGLHFSNGNGTTALLTIPIETT
jgi:two-component sensor histidine kinase